MHAIHYDPLHDEIVVTNPFAQSILTFRGDTSGDEPPVRVIQGPSTKLGTPDRFGLDPVNGEIYVAEDDGIRVYPRLSTGDVAPIRHLHGDWDPGDVVIDTVHNLIVATGSYDGGKGRGIMMFNRIDNGEVKPRAVIGGPSTGIESTRQIQVYPEKGLIFASQTLNNDERKPGSYFVGVWSIHDKGDVPPRWKIGGPKSTLLRARGIVLNPKQKEIHVADMLLNAVLTYYYPEIF